MSRSEAAKRIRDLLKEAILIAAEHSLSVQIGQDSDWDDWISLDGSNVNKIEYSEKL